MMRPCLLALILALASILPVGAVEPGEMLKDPGLEARARTISEGLRCLVCQNESIDDSHADLARDIRLLVRQRLEAGDSDQQVRDFLVDRFGQFILLKPPLGFRTLLLWGAPIIVLMSGAAWLFLASRRRRVSDAPAPALDEVERKKLDEILTRARG